MIGAFAAAPAPPSRAIVDPGLLTYRDRAGAACGSGARCASSGTV
jgi:hypothetical protein